MVRFLCVCLAIVTITATAAIHADCKGQETAAALPRTVEVNVLAYRKLPDGTKQGSIHPTIITVGGSAKSRRRVAFVETEVSGTGDQWRSAGWAAAITAAQIADFDPLATQVTIEFEGWLDGPSAGALMTVGILAALRGETPRADAAMTGTINPDATIGPVGGISHKIAGAAAAGKKLVLIPLDSRMEYDDPNAKPVDLVDHGRKLGVEVRQVGDIYAAYRLLTGKELPRPPHPGDIEVPHEVSELMKIKFGFWMNHYQMALRKIGELDEEESANDWTPVFLEDAARRAKRAQRLFDEGEFSGAYFDAVFAAYKAYLGMEYARGAQTYSARGIEAMIERVKQNDWLTQEFNLVSAVMRAKPPRTIDQLSEYIGACNILIEALAYQQFANDAIPNIPEDDEDRAYTLALNVGQDQIIAWIDLLLVRDSLDLLALKGGRPLSPDAPAAQVAEFFRRAADANNAVFESLVIEPTASSLGATAGTVRKTLYDKDYTYATTKELFGAVPGQLTRQLGDGPALAYGQVAMSMSQYLQSASLLAKYYALSARLDEQMKVTEIKSEGALNNWLEFSEDQTMRNIGALKSRGIDPTTCLQTWEMGHLLRQRDLDDKLEAIDIFWHANLNAAIVRFIDSNTPAPAGK